MLVRAQPVPLPSPPAHLRSHDPRAPVPTSRHRSFVAAAAENAIDALSYKPHAIITSHKGLTVEIGNTDAEGELAAARVSLCW